MRNKRLAKDPDPDGVQARVDEMIGLIEARRLTSDQVTALNAALFDLAKEQAGQMYRQIRDAIKGTP
ncbi:MAG TPA: hypothetical protein VGN51_19705 [Acidimicrobiia bacterium]|jgi:hypothetical protein